MTFTDTSTRPGETASGTDELLSAADVTKSYRAGSRLIEILHGVSLAVLGGEMVAVMGPSGSGKSTLLHCLAGLEPPSSGDVRLLGRSVSAQRPAALAAMRRDEVGFVFQSYNLLPSLTAFENVALPQRLAGRRPDAEQIRDALGRVGLAGHVHDRPAVMSGGEQQRVALARVLAQEPRLVFADEPTGALDTTSGAVVMRELRRIAGDGPRSVLTVTHDPEVAAQCDRVLFLRDGYLVGELAAPTADRVAETMTGLASAAVAR